METMALYPLGVLVGPDPTLVSVSLRFFQSLDYFSSFPTYFVLLLMFYPSRSGVDGAFLPGVSDRGVPRRVSSSGLRWVPTPVPLTVFLFTEFPRRGKRP